MPRRARVPRMNGISATAGDTSAQMHTTDCAGDDESLDLAGSFEDRVDLRVAVPAFDRMVADVASAAEDLHCLLGDAHRDLAGFQLRHRPFPGLERLVVAPHPGR